MRRLVAPIALVVLLGLVPAARAATVTPDTTTGVLGFTANPGEANALTIAPVTCVGGAACLDITDTGAPLANTNPNVCSAMGPNTVRCPAARFKSYSALLGDGDDAATLDAGLPGTVDAGPGDDRIDGGATSETFIGSDGIDRVSYGRSTAAQPVTASIGDAVCDGRGGTECDDVKGDVEELEGGPAGDALAGSPAADTLVGGAGPDSLAGNGGNDGLYGEAGADTLQGGDGDDLLDGGADGDMLGGGPGTDVADWSPRTAPVSGSPDGVANDGQAGEGDNVGMDVENLRGGSGGDALTGDDGANLVQGGGGNDSITGGGGADQLQGGDGDDAIAARDSAVDLVACGNGADTAVVDPEDTVSDCETVDLGGAVAPPVLGRSFNISRASGVVFVILPPGAGATAAQSRRHRLEDVESIPVGSRVDARRGAAILTSARNGAGATQSGRFSSGQFVVRQARRANAFTELVLAGASFRDCTARPAQAQASQRRRTKRRLFGSGTGRFRTKGRFSSATVRGTVWGVHDRCDGTLTRVRRGTVLVRDFRRHRTIRLRTGRTYLARAPIRR